MTTATTVPVAEPGLSTAEVAQRVAAGQSNDYPVVTSRPVGVILRTNIVTRFNALLGSLLVVILIVGPLQDALFGLTLVGARPARSRDRATRHCRPGRAGTAGPGT
jgi:hypothetical protein